MPGDIGAVATLLNTVASWLLSKDGYDQFTTRREGERLKQAFMAAHAQWKRLPTPDNKRAKDEALDALRRWSDAP